MRVAVYGQKEMSNKKERGKMLLRLEKKRNGVVFFQLYFKTGCWSCSAQIFVSLAGLSTMLPEPRTGNVFAVYEKSEASIWEYLKYSTTLKLL